MLHPNESLATSTSLSSGMADLSIRFLTSAGTGCHLRLLVAQRGELLLLLPLKVLIPRSLLTAASAHQMDIVCGPHGRSETPDHVKHCLTRNLETRQFPGSPLLSGGIFLAPFCLSICLHFLSLTLIHLRPPQEGVSGKLGFQPGPPPHAPGGRASSGLHHVSQVPASRFRNWLSRGRCPDPGPFPRCEHSHFGHCQATNGTSLNRRLGTEAGLVGSGDCSLQDEPLGFRTRQQTPHPPGLAGAFPRLSTGIRRPEDSAHSGSVVIGRPGRCVISRGGRKASR